ncbi:Protein of unknown function [Gryllus bimaculatus]|nr:Protein of unknown function [Gryllus bimaculatus]
MENFGATQAVQRGPRPLERRRLPRLLRFLLDTRPVTAPALRRALGPSLRQRPLPLSVPPSEDEPGPSGYTPDERTPLLNINDI